jgi:predicted nucleic acid-binding protein
MIAVADTSPISALLRIGRLTLLTALFESVLIPCEVGAELDEGKHILGDWRPMAHEKSVQHALALAGER